MDAEILKQILQETRDNGSLLARVDERVQDLQKRADRADSKDANHEDRIEALEAPSKSRKYLIGVFVGIGAVVGVAQAVSAFF